LDLQKNGWVTWDSGERDATAIELIIDQCGHALGKSVSTRPQRFVEALTPRKQNQARLRSLSGIHGLSELPLHADGSHWATPCRYVVLGCVCEDAIGTDTLLLDTASMSLSITEKTIALCAPFLVRSGRNSFYSCILSNDRNFIRIDPCCMEPLSSESFEALRIFCYSRNISNVQRISWKVGMIAVIDNWRVLHGRESVSSTNSRRRLLRAMVMQ